MKSKQMLFMFLSVFAAAFLIALTITTCIAVAMGADAVPLIELRNDFIMAIFIAAVQMIWAGSDRDNRTYIIRTIVHVAVLLTGCTLLMVWFGWLPPSKWIFFYYAGFLVSYLIIWVIFWRANKKKWAEMNQKLQEYQQEKKE